VQSELHERLEYLVNYSSQLIFVSGVSVAQQKKTLESFVFQQQTKFFFSFSFSKPSIPTCLHGMLLLSFHCISKCVAFQR